MSLGRERWQEEKRTVLGGSALAGGRKAPRGMRELFPLHQHMHMWTTQVQSQHPLWWQLVWG